MRKPQRKLISVSFFDTVLKNVLKERPERKAQTYKQLHQNVDEG